MFARMRPRFIGNPRCMRVGIIVILAVACTACSPPRCVVAIFDVSSTVIGDGMTEHYRSDFERILMSLGSRDVVRANVIVEDPSRMTGRQRWPIEIRVRNLDWFTRFGRRNELERLRKIQEPELTKLLGARTHASPITDALIVAAEALNDSVCREVSDRRIVVFSDMLENSARWEMKDDLSVRVKDTGVTTTTLSLGSEETPLDTEQEVELLLKLEAARKPPSLQGIQVFAIGALGTDPKTASGPNEPTPIHRREMLKLFWQRYLESAGATLAPGRWWQLRLPDWP